MAYNNVINDLLNVNYTIALHSAANTLEIAQDFSAFLADNFDLMTPQAQEAHRYLITHLFKLTIESLQETRNHLLTRYERTH